MRKGGYLPRQGPLTRQQAVERAEPLVRQVQNPEMLKEGEVGRRGTDLFLGLGNRRYVTVTGAAADLLVPTSPVSNTKPVFSIRPYSR